LRVVALVEELWEGKVLDMWRDIWILEKIWDGVWRTMIYGNTQCLFGEKERQTFIWESLIAW